MYLVRECWERELRSYSVNITEEYLAGMTNWINDHIVDKDKCIETITPAQFKTFWFDGIDEWDESIVVKYPWNENTYNDTIGSLIHDYVEEDVWDSDYEVVDGYTDDYNDYIEGIE